MSNEKKNNPATGNAPSSNFLRAIIDNDLAAGTHAREGMPQVITRFPPEPNGYLHVGHAKSICLNFGLARDYAGRCHLRFDDTKPEKEDQEYVDTIMDSVKWLGFSWNQGGEEFLHYASDYFDKLYEMAEYLIREGKAYVDSQTPEEMAKNRGNFGTPGTNSPSLYLPAFMSRNSCSDSSGGRLRKGELVPGVEKLPRFLAISSALWLST